MNRLKKIVFMMCLYTSLLASCGKRNNDTGDKLDELLNDLTHLELEIESFSEEQNNLTEQLGVQQEKNQELENYILQMLQQLKQMNVKESNVLVNNLHVENLTFQDNGERFRFNYITDYDGGGMGLIYDEIGPEFRIIYVDGHKLLVKASDETQVCLRDFENLGKPFYFKEYDPVYGGKDSKDGYCGWVLPVYNGDTYSLYDFDTFETLLVDCDIDFEFKAYGDIFYYNPLYSFYLEAYDPIYGGHDIQNGGCGFVCQIFKDDVCYLVDANDFSLILDSNFINQVYSYTDENDITQAVFNYQYMDEYGCYIGSFETRMAEEIIPYKSDVLTKK